MSNGVINPDLNVLVVDDAQIILIGIQAILEDLGLKNIVCTDDVNFAIKEIFTGKYDLILTDINMPIMDGYKIAQSARQWELDNKHLNKKLYVYAVTGSSISQIKSDKRDFTIFDEILIKPFNHARLCKLISDI
jgi:CheY-like chemotaxis protein